MSSSVPVCVLPIATNNYQQLIGYTEYTEYGTVSVILSEGIFCLLHVIRKGRATWDNKFYFGCIV